MAVTALEHLLVLSDDIDAARDFYRDALGLTEGPRPPLEFAGHWLYAGERPLLHIGDRASYTAHAASIGLAVAAEPALAAVDHIAFAATDYEEAAARLERCGIEARRNTVPGIGLRQLFFSAPDGVRIEVNVSA
jgi:catechol 2,3-dioxygenase-like lactoylglutathione lyase family enzyme